MAANKNKREKSDARKIQESLDVSYVHALRLLREGKYIVRNGAVQEVVVQ